MQGDNAFVGRFLGAAALGLYALAYNLANLPSSAITSVVARLAFPVYASMQDDPGSLRRGYLRSVRIVVLFTLPASLLLLTLAPDLVPGLYGERWRSAVPAVQVLSIFGFLKAFNTAPGSFLQATGHPERLQRVMLIQLVLFGLMLYPMGRAWGIAGVGAAVTAGNLAAAGVVVWQVRRVAGIGFGAHLRAAWPAMPPGAAMGGAAMAVVSVMRDAAWGWRAGSAAGAGLFVYAAALLALDGDLRRDWLARLGRRNR